MLSYIAKCSWRYSYDFIYKQSLYLLKHFEKQTLEEHGGSLHGQWIADHLGWYATEKLMDCCPIIVNSKYRQEYSEIVHTMRLFPFHICVISVLYA